MKATKKIVSITLALVLAVLAFVMPVSAAKTYPFIFVDGFGSTTLYQNVGTEDEKPAFATDDDSLSQMGTNIGTAFVKGYVSYGVAKKDYNKFADEFFPVVNEYIKAIGYNTDGTPVDSTVGFKQLTKPMSDYTAEEKASEFGVFAQEYAKKYGEEYVYSFRYDWRQSPIDIAKQLKDYIDEVKDETGAKKVNVVAMSLGASVLLAYMSQFGGKSLNNVVFASPAWLGTSLVGNVMTKNVELDIFAVENYLVQLANVSATTHITAFAISFIASQEGLSHEYFGDINYALQQMLPRSYTDTLVPYLAGMPALWSLVPVDYYDNAKTCIFPDGMNASLEAKIDAYHNMQVNAKSIVEKAMSDGMKFGIVLGYNCQMIPISSEYEQSDTVIDVKYMSGGATCAKYLQAHDDWGKIYKQAVKDGHNHVSWDSKIDASTCMFPEQTWFIKNMQHGYNADYGQTDIVMWLLGSSKQCTVQTDPENYPQFFLYNTYKRTTKPITVKGMIGDVDGSGDITTVDARLALKMAAGHIKPTEDQLVLADLDEDGSITTEDVLGILGLAAGIY